MNKAIKTMVSNKLQSRSISGFFVFSILTLFSLFSVSLAAQDSLAMNKLGHLEYPSWNLSDVWGYADTTGNEFALVGMADGFDVVDVTTPSNPISKVRIYGAYSVWRDIKSWSHFAYVSHDFQYTWSNVPDQGILIVDLDSLQTPRFKYYQPLFVLPNGQTDSLRTIHNLFIDENGVLYVFGSNLFNGGVLMFDVATDPWNPIYLGRFESFYHHDGYARNDTLFGAAVNNGFMTVIDVTNKAVPQLLATKTTPNQFTHNTWLSDDGNTVFTTDELPGAYIAAYDVSDLNNITELDRIRVSNTAFVIPHNVHVYGDFLVTSYYTSGLDITDAADPENLVRVGYYDTSPTTGGGFTGAWGAYPYLPSGNILVTDMQEGLFVLHAEYTGAARLYGVVVDSVTKNTLIGANIELVQSPIQMLSKIDGSFKIGVAETMVDTILVTKAGYRPFKMPVNFTNGNYDTIRVAMLPLAFHVDEDKQSSFNLFPNPSSAYFDLTLNDEWVNKNTTVYITNSIGQVVYINKRVNVSEMRIEHNLPVGMYLVTLKGDDKKTSIKLLVQ